MAESITRIVLTGGPAAGKTTLISRILKEFKPEDGWKVITIPETATELISGFGIGPFPNCVSMEEFQYFVIEDQLHKEKLALKAAQMVPYDKILIVYDRALLDDKAYITDEQFRQTLAYFGKTEEQVLAGYDAVLHLVTCAKGAEYAYNFGNAARYESVEEARQMDDRTLRDCQALQARYGAAPVEMMQTYLNSTSPRIERRIRQQKNGGGYLYFYTEKRIAEDGSRWVTEKPISEKEYVAYLMESDLSLHAVRKVKYRFGYRSSRMEIDVYPFAQERAVLFVYGGGEKPELPEEIRLIKEVTNQAEYKNRQLAASQIL